MRIEKLHDDIYIVRFEFGYDCAMHFWRYQEFHESVCSRFRFQSFSLLDYMEWYCKKKESSFTYAYDWAGFNLPGKVIKRAHDKGIPDPNKYDRFMLHVYELLADWNGNDQFYIMGLSKEYEAECVNHELAHALFGTNADYAWCMGKLLCDLPEPIINSLQWDFMQMGYHTDLIEDETQAWFSTGVHSRLNRRQYKGFIPKFRRTFQRFKRQLHIQI